MRIKMREKLAFALGDFGGNFVWTFVASFFMIYATDTAGLAAGAIGTILLFARFIDGGSDIFMGGLVDRTHSKMGKARPWVLWCSIPLAIVTFMLFNVPGNISNVGKLVYAAFFYVLVCLLYTAVNVPYSSLTSLITTDQQDRVVMTSFRCFFATLAGLIISISSEGLVQTFGGGQTGWTKLALTFAIVFFVFNLISVLGVKEKKRTSSTDKENVNASKPSFGLLFKSLLKNKYFYIVLGVYICFYINMGVGAARIYYAQYVFGNVNLYGMMAMVSIIPMIIAIIFSSSLIKKFGKRNTCIAGCIVSVAGYIIMTLFPTSIAPFFVGIALGSMGLSPTSASLATYVSDIGDFIYWKSNVKVEGTVFSLTSVGIKVGTGVGAGLVGLILAAGKYVPNLTKQPASSLFAIKTLNIYIPLLASVLIILLLFALNIDKFMPQVLKEIKEREANQTASREVLNSNI